MVTGPSETQSDVVGVCAGMHGAVSVERADRVLNGLGAGASVLASDRIRTHADGCARFEFRDGSTLVLGRDTMCFIRIFDFDRVGDSMTAEFDARLGSFVFSASAAAGPQDAVDIFIDDMTLHVRAARVAVARIGAAFNLISLLPGRGDGPHGDVLVTTRIGVRTLSEPWQSLRVSCDTGDASATMALPSSMMTEAFADTGLADDVRGTVADVGDGAPPHGGAFDTGAASFEPFHALNDRLFERRFVPGQLYPVERDADSGYRNELLEDAFDGERFRVPPDENVDKS